MLGLYIHIPFCAQRCGYCDFYSTTDQQKIDTYSSALVAALENQPFDSKSVDTIYFGGGTPNLLGAENLNSVLQAANQAFEISPDAEISMEANPESISLEILKQLKTIGFNRISFGVQSSNNAELKALGRLHSAEQAKNAIINADKAGFQHISADLMLGIPHQTENSLQSSIKFLTELPLDHISAYILKIEPDTAFAKTDMQRFCADDDKVVEFYLNTVKLLSKSGFQQYEISNFAKPGGKSKHNLKYWDSQPYIGIGPSAHSFVDGRRFYTSSDLDEFIANSAAWKFTQDGKGGDFYEYAMLRLRLRPGLDLKKVNLLYPEIDTDLILKKAENLQPENYVEIKNKVITLTPEGFLLSNFITADLLF